MPFIPALGRQRQADLCEFRVSLLYGVSSRTAKVTQRNPVSRNQRGEKKRRSTFTCIDWYNIVWC